MGQWLSLAGPAEPSLDRSPEGRPDNSYWRQRRTEASWKLREALLDGNVSVVTNLLGVDAGKHADLLLGDADADASGPRDPLTPQGSDDDQRAGCSQVCACLCFGRGAPAEEHAAPAKKPDSLPQVLPPETANSAATSASVSEGLAAPSAPHTSPLALLDLSSHRWEDDGAHSALHYLARGRCASTYAGMRTNFPITGPDASPGRSADDSRRDRVALIAILQREGYLTREAVLMTNAQGATPVHVAAAVSNQDFVEAILRTNATAAPTFSTAAVDSALLHCDAGGLVPVDVAAKFGHTGVARYLGLGLLSSLPHMIAFCRDTLSQSSVARHVSKRHDTHVTPAAGAGGPPGRATPGRSAGGALSREDSGGGPLHWQLVAGVGNSVGDGDGGVPGMMVCEDDSARRTDLKRKERQVAARLGVPLAEAARLIETCGFDVEEAVLAGSRSRAQPPSAPSPPPDAGPVSSDGALAQALDELDVKTLGGAGSGEREAGGEEGLSAAAAAAAREQECPVCFDLVSVEEARKARCNEALAECRHFACDECMFGHVRVRVMDEGDVSLLVCPAEGCRARIPAAQVEEILQQDPEAVARFWQLQSAALVARNERVRWCPAAGCSATIELPPYISSRSVAVTCTCGARFCAGCSATPAHEPASCAAWEMLIAALETCDRDREQRSQQWIEASTTRCSRCRSPVERSFGCNHMRCTQVRCLVSWF
jgi:hypothetical protein